MGTSPAATRGMYFGRIGEWCQLMGWSQDDSLVGVKEPQEHSQEWPCHKMKNGAVW
ncbi:MAG TPA: hypothetical protein VGR58_14070 [Candidatus Acidoferrum sp.]|nr:hypothetical protein [Candidatus Acidoferrum sp.]